MKKVLVLGATGRIARHVIEDLGDDRDLQLTLLARNVGNIPSVPVNAVVFQANVLSKKGMAMAMMGQDIVYANLTGDDIDLQAKAVISAMTSAGVKRLIFVTTLGIYDEVPGRFGEWNRREIGAFLPPFRRAADAIEDSGLEYTILRPAWLTDENEVAYETTGKGEPFKGTEVSRKSVAALIVEIIKSPRLWLKENMGVSKPGTDGDEPAFL